ncbi:MAG TPA: DUF1150 family protein [Micropepsaceae bacterium]|nr:DUF1150 family protein [Micropepsaceae bacterium]HRK71744.1 DUF1150 family protein [Micropepsaceae bacterium]
MRDTVFSISKEALANLGAPHLAYVREVDASVLSAEGILPTGMRVKRGTRFFAVHLANGVRAAVHDDRDSAFAAARANGLVPMAVH